MEQQAEPEVIRLAVVMNGGVSLAVWMGGVTHEINRLLNRGLGDESSAAWSAILNEPSQGLEDQPPLRRVVVDYVAGTSAGGLNGSLLATAIARRAPLSKLKDLWLKSARLTEEALLLGPGNDGTALLDGPFFEKQILGALDKIPGTAPNKSRATNTSDEVEDAVTLLVTATALTASPLQVQDAHKHFFKVSDRRRVYKFESASRSVKGEDTFDTEVLARAARASASFPAAFEPVEETAKLRDRRIDRWSLPAESRPSDPDASHPAGTSWLIDGGVLDNAPFEPMLEEMARNPRADRGQRWVVYVVPSSPGLAGTSATIERLRDAPTDPPPWFDVIKKLWGIKGEVDLRADIEALRRLQEEARSTHERPEVLISKPPILPPEQVEEFLLPTYKRTRARGFAQSIAHTAGQVHQLKKVDIPEEHINELIEPPASFLPTSLCPTRQGEWQWGTTVARRLTLWMSRDVRLRNISKADIRTLARAESDLERLHGQMAGLFAGDPELAKGTPAEALKGREEEVQRIRAEVLPLMSNAVSVWAKTFASDTDMALDIEEAWGRLFATEVTLNFAQWHGQPSLPEFDVVLVDTGAPNVARAVAPNHPDLRGDLQARPDDKLYGTSLGHFGAFGRAKYRSHDWAWGRIDGAVCLADALTRGVDEDRRTELRDALIAEIVRDENSTSEDHAFTLETLRTQTREALDVTSTGLLVDSILGGEVELSPTVEALEQAADLLTARTPGWLVVDTVTDLLAGTLQAVDGVARAASRFRDGLQSTATKISGLIAKIWRRH